MTALLVRWRRTAVIGLLACGVVAGTALAAIPAEAATVKNLVGNGSAEAGTRSLPRGWVKGAFGANTRALSTVSGGAQSGRKFVRTKISRYSSGAAWWSTPVASVRGGAKYTYSEYYRSNSRTKINAYFTVGGKIVGKQLAVVSPSARWKLARYSVTAPSGASKVRFGHSLSSSGFVDVDNVTLAATSSRRPGSSSTTGLISLTFDDGWTNQYTNAAPVMKAAGNLPGTFYLVSSFMGSGPYMSVAQAKQLQASGSEIGSHTVSHTNLADASATQLTAELANSKRSLEKDFGPVTSLAYPFGASNADVRTATAKYYTSARSTNPGPNASGKYDKYALTIGYVLNTTPLSTVQGWINEAKASNTWLILCYHRVADDQPNDLYTLKVSSFESQVKAVKDSGVRVVTVSDAVKLTS